MRRDIVLGQRNGEFRAKIRKSARKCAKKVRFFCPKTTLNGSIVRNMHHAPNIKEDLDSTLQDLLQPVAEEVSRMSKGFAIVI